MPKITVNKKGAKRARNGHLWIYRSDIISIGDALGGDIVSVIDEGNNLIGKAFYSGRSEISLRLFSNRNEVVDKEFWRSRILDAAKRRQGIRGANAYRLINSEADLIPSLIIDNYDGNFVMQNLAQGSEALKSTFLEILIEEFKPKSVIERNDARVRGLEGLELKNSVLFGDDPKEVVIDQDGVKFIVSPLDGQKTGSFLDQRENHLAARNYAYGKALDCFSFSGGFALNLSRACESVSAIDISEDAVALAKRNAELNGAGNIKFITANAFDKLRELEMNGERFDTVVLDPPAFVKNRAALKGAVRGYREINLRALKLLNPGGVLISCSCSFHFSEEIFLEVLEEAARDARKKVHLIEKRMQSSDHPILLGMPESYYLKCFILRVIN